MGLLKIITIALAFALPASTAVASSRNLKTISLPVGRNNVSGLSTRDRQQLAKRAGTVNAVIDNEETLYYANITLGSPPQAMRLHLDTGSSDLWVNLDNSSFCSFGNSCTGGTYDPKASSSLVVVNNKFNISYVDGSGASGNYVTDTLGFSGLSLDNFQFGTGEISSSSQGILGIGYTSNEVQVQRAGMQSYPNLPQALKDNEKISRNAYSLWLNDQESGTGTILFGGVNYARLKKPLYTLPVIRATGGFTELVIALTQVHINGKVLTDGSSSMPAAALLDSGATLTYLPNDVANKIYEEVGATYSQEAGLAYVPCSLQDNSSSVSFVFSGATIGVPYEELVIDMQDIISGPGPAESEKGKMCVFGITTSLSTYYSILGDTFLRSAYVIYDLDNNQISVAETVFNSTTDDIQELPSGTSLPPSAVVPPDAVTSVVNGVTGLADRSGGTLTGSAVQIRPSYFALSVLILVATAFMS